MKWSDELRMEFLNQKGLGRLIAVNVGVFLILALVRLILFLSGQGTGIATLLDWVALKSDLHMFMRSPWTLITYMFIHEEILHILFNMLVLYWTGRIFSDFLGSSKLVAVYILGGIVGGLFYMAAYNLFPVFAESVAFARLIGASAGVIAVLVAIATLVPDYTVHLILFGPVRLKFIAIFLVILYVVSIPLGNAGGNISHLGGALTGFVYTKSLRSGVNLGKWIEAAASFVMQFFSRQPGMRIVHGKRNRNRQADAGLPRQEVIDAILDKISKSGYSSLSSEEKETLFRASKDQGRN